MGVPNTGFFGARLVQAREVRGLSCSDIARQIGVTRASVSNYELGKQSPRPDMLEKIASMLNVPIPFFMRPVPEFKQNTVFYRSNTTATKGARKRAEKRYEWLQEVVVYLQEYFDFPTLNLPTLDIPKDFEEISMDMVEEIALECRKFFGIDPGRVRNMVLLLDNNGVLVPQGYFEAEKLDAFSDTPAGGHPLVFLGLDKASAVRSRFDAAHELAHLLLHKHVNQRHINGNRAFKIIENQAHRFAGAFLLPESDFLEELWSPNLDTFRALKSRWKISIGAQIMRCTHLEIVPEDQLKRLWINYNRRGWRKNEPLDDRLEREESRVLRRSFESLIGGNIRSKEQILMDLRLPSGDIEEFSGLPIGFFSDKKAEILPLPRVKNAKENASKSSERGRLINFPKR